MPEIIFVNQQRAMAVVQLSSNICSVIEIVDGSEINTGDIVIGDFNSEGPTSIMNQSTMDKMKIIVQNAMLGQDQAILRAQLH